MGRECPEKLAMARSLKSFLCQYIRVSAIMKCSSHNFKIPIQVKYSSISSQKVSGALCLVHNFVCCPYNIWLLSVCLLKKNDRKQMQILQTRITAVLYLKF